MSPDAVLCRYWKHKPVYVEQIVIPDKFIPVVLRPSHDTPIAAHPGRDKTSFATKKKHYWTRLRKDVETNAAPCAVCAQHMGTTKGLVPMLQYPLPKAP